MKEEPNAMTLLSFIATFAVSFTNGLPFCETYQCKLGKMALPTYMNLAKIDMISDIGQETSAVKQRFRPCSSWPSQREVRFLGHISSHKPVKWVSGETERGQPRREI